MQLADYIKNTYESEFGPINVSTESIAIEILGHVFEDKLGGVFRGIRKLTGIIDIAEAENDPNRKIWDSLVPMKNIIFAILGRNA